MKTNDAWAGRRWRGLLSASAVVVLATCSKTPSETGSGPAGSASAPASATKPAASAAAGGTAVTAGPATAFAGSYVAKQGAVDSPTKEKTWTDDTGADAVGKGTVELSVDGPAGDGNGPPRKVIGEAKGPLGPMSITGTFDGKEVRANMAPTQANAPGAMTGFMTLTAEGPASLKGTLRVSSGNARIVREATVELARK